jgi:FMN reductase
MAKVAILSGSPNKQSRLYGLIGAAEQELVRTGHHVDIIHVAELPADDLLRANFSSEAIQAALTLVKEADVVIVASLVYKAAYTGILKTFLDLIPERGLADKLLLPLFVGGSTAHLLAVEYALKPVLSALGGRHILGGVYAVDQSVARKDNGGFELAEETAERLGLALNELEEEAEWRQRRRRHSF